MPISGADMKRLAIFLDGTWNTLNNNTNVWRLKSLTAEKAWARNVVRRRAAASPAGGSMTRSSKRILG
ncbi:hypothetical protein GCM10007857_43620 [Bradyrhizobium iriomotense]|uniref:DUF2235 domain-containing protein n=1 Tax=Bradyrhizobium iriomotense TaxID=441950 RepID=A0ABQ6B4V3_9BRAD|nr:hypothetical protein GCM10007857_43620 [Bradyrhizobium iriomotense]